MSDRIRGRIVRVVDGDTVTMRFADGTFTVRLWGIDAPESSQPYGSVPAPRLCGNTCSALIPFAKASWEGSAPGVSVMV